MERLNPKKCFLLVVVAVLFLAPTGSRATIYTYVDANGRLHLTNVPADPRYRPAMQTISRFGPVTTSVGYEDYIRAAASRFAVDPHLVRAVIKAESNFNRMALSSKGAQGLMQLMPDTASDMNVNDPFNPEENIHGGTRYLRKLLELFNGNLKLALAAYNAGPERVIREGNVIPRISETINYVKIVMKHYEQYRNSSSY
ncbi:MAG: hypothetical protein A2511_01435 [Deltaproteobacteria bacterium RIFOXYD12_FULL_50_9]|nr:MAG: hypothetical protein A2511_01435 [Deltaproteobacteria bacterium RIFOXYD12_FULL_50_9]